jgi:hypothetical protein
VLAFLLKSYPICRLAIPVSTGESVDAHRHIRRRKKPRRTCRHEIATAKAALATSFLLRENQARRLVVFRAPKQQSSSLASRRVASRASSFSVGEQGGYFRPSERRRKSFRHRNCLRPTWPTVARGS